MILISRFGPALLGFGLIISGCNAGPRSAIVRAEERLDMPRNGLRISDYDRYYIVDKDFIVGRFFSVSGKNGMIIIARSKKEVPFAAGGGCSIINVRFDRKRDMWDRSFCNGI